MCLTGVLCYNIISIEMSTGRRRVNYLENLFHALDFSSMGDAALRVVSVLLCLMIKVNTREADQKPKHGLL